MTLFGVPVRRGGGWLAALTATSLCATAAELLLPITLGRLVDAVRDAGEAGVAGAAGDVRQWLACAAILLAAVVCCETLGYLAAGTAAARATPWLRHRLRRHALGIALAIGVLALSQDWLSPAELLTAGQYALLASTACIRIVIE